MKSIVVFNNKGGVGKTTLLCNIASYLQIRKKKKVLVIDTDPQCNATSYMFPSAELEKIYLRSSPTIYDVLKPLQRGKGYSTAPIPIIKSPGFEVDVIPGDTKLSLSEDFLSKDWLDSKAGDPRGLQTTMVFKELLLKLEDYDYVFFDVGPSLGAINRCVLAASDYFIIPMSSDIFSLQAIENISISLQEWSKQLKKGLESYKDLHKEEFELRDEQVDWVLKFAGYITQQYTAKTVNGVKQPVTAYEKIINKIPATISKHMAEINGTDTISNEKLGEITNLHSLVPLSQNSAVPIFNLKSEHGVVGAHFNKVKDYEEILKQMSAKLLTNLTDLQ